MKYMVIDADKNRDNEDIVEFETAGEAIEYAESMFNATRKNKYDVTHTGYFAAVESANPDEEADDHYDFNPIVEYIVDGEVLFFHKSWDELCGYLNRHPITDVSNDELIYIAEQIPNVNHLDDYFISFEMENRTGLLFENYDGYYAFHDFIKDCCEILRK